MKPKRCKTVTEPSRLLASQLTENPALIAVHGSGSGHVLLHDIEAHRRRTGLGPTAAVGGDVADAEEDLPRQQVREERRRRREQRVLSQEGSDGGPEGSAGESLRRGEERRREREEVVEVGGDPPLHALQGLPSAHDHD